MATNNYEKLIEEIGNMSVFQLAEFVERFKEKFGVSDVMPMAAAPAAAAEPAAKAEEKSEFKVTLKEAGDKLKAIKALKAVTGLGLSEAKAAVEGAPTVIAEAAPKDKAMEIKAKLEEAGAKVELS